MSHTDEHAFPPIPQGDPLITLPLTRLVYYILGQGYWHDKSIHPDDARIIFEKTKNQKICYVQWADEHSPHLRLPRLWEFGAWQTDYERWKRAKIRSELERKERNILEANVKMVTRYVEQYFALRGPAAIALADKYVRQKMNKHLSAIGVSKLYKTESEIP